ncbi:MAG: sigma-70 family RNA polymerase sigma factor [Spirochaetes bacterium]|nr:sigma-70 family RNA polymerase sigma factor [Spirochaetota bacterium]
MENDKAGELFDRLYREWGPMVLRRCRFLMRDEDLAVDAMQETFVQVLRRMETLDLERPSSLLYRIATNTCLNLIRGRGRCREDFAGDDLDAIAAVDENEERALAGDLLGRIFHREEASTRVMAVLHFVDDWTLEAIAEETGLSVSGVRKRLRGLKERAKGLRGAWA